MEWHRIKIDRQEVEVIESDGKGDPIFLCHGNSNAAESFLNLMNGSLGKRHRMIALSFPGHGASSNASEPEYEYTMRELGRFVARIVCHYGPSQYWLVGQSLGGHALVQSLSLFPRAKGIALISAPPVSPATMGQAFREDPSSGRLFKDILDEDEARLLALCFTGPTNISVHKELIKNIQKTDPQFRPALGKSLMKGDMLDERSIIAEAKIPVLLVVGTEDRFLEPQYYATLPLGYFWKEQVHFFEGNGHVLHMEDPGRLESLIDGFVSEGGNAS